MRRRAGLALLQRSVDGFCSKTLNYLNLAKIVQGGIMANTVSRPTITVEAAQKMIAAAAKKAEEIQRKMVIAICDESGILKAFQRMDGAPLLSVDIAQNKAWTSVSFGVPTHKWFDFVKDDPPLL